MDQGGAGPNSWMAGLDFLGSAEDLMALPPGDMPFLDTATLNAICNADQHGRGGSTSSVPDGAAVPGPGGMRWNCPEDLATGRDSPHGGDDSDEEDAQNVRSGGCKRSRGEGKDAARVKASKEKARRGKINDRFADLAKLIDPGNEPKTDKPSILADAIKYVQQLTVENHQLRQLNKFLEERVSHYERERGQNLYQQSLLIQGMNSQQPMMSGMPLQQPLMQMSSQQSMMPGPHMQMPPSGMTGPSTSLAHAVLPKTSHLMQQQGYQHQPVQHCMYQAAPQQQVTSHQPALHHPAPQHPAAHSTLTQYPSGQFPATQQQQQSLVLPKTEDGDGSGQVTSSTLAPALTHQHQQQACASAPPAESTADKQQQQYTVRPSSSTDVTHEDYSATAARQSDSHQRYATQPVGQSDSLQLYPSPLVQSDVQQRYTLPPAVQSDNQHQYQAMQPAAPQQYAIPSYLMGLKPAVGSVSMQPLQSMPLAGSQPPPVHWVSMNMLDTTQDSLLRPPVA